jgi:hypothetical protein
VRRTECDSRVSVHRNPHGQIGKVLHGMNEITSGGGARRPGPAKDLLVRRGVDDSTLGGPAGVVVVDVYRWWRESPRDRRPGPSS